jgi:hypothetical protein
VQGGSSGRRRRKKRNKHVHSCVGRCLRLVIFGLASWLSIDRFPRPAGSFRGSESEIEMELCQPVLGAGACAICVEISRARQGQRSG